MYIPIDKDSYGTILLAWLVCAALIAVIFLFIKPWWITVPLTVALVIFMVFITWFFRIPQRTIPEGENIVTSVCDGEVVEIAKDFENEFLKEDCIRVSVFMSVYSVHCNYWPVSGEISYYQYHPGKYLVAFHPKSSEKNEHSSTCIRRADGKQVFFKQIAGNLVHDLAVVVQQTLGLGVRLVQHLFDDPVHLCGGIIGAVHNRAGH